MIPQGNTSLPAALAATPPARKAGRGGLSSQEREDRLAFIRAAIARGETLRTIGAALGVSGQSVQAMCARHGIKPAGVPMFRFTSEMRRRYAKAVWADPVKREALLRARRAAEYVHSKETIRKVVSLKGQKSAKKIAEEMGFRSRYVVIGIWGRASRASRATDTHEVSHDFRA